MKLRSVFTHHYFSPICLAISSPLLVSVKVSVCLSDCCFSSWVLLRWAGAHFCPEQSISTAAFPVGCFRKLWGRVESKESLKHKEKKWNLSVLLSFSKVRLHFATQHSIPPATLLYRNSKSIINYSSLFEGHFITGCMGWEVAVTHSEGNQESCFCLGTPWTLCLLSSTLLSRRRWCPVIMCLLLVSS